MTEKEKLWTELFGDADARKLDKFRRFHAENKHVYDLFKRFTYEAKEAGRNRFSGWMIANRIRWYTSIETKGTDYKLSNDFIAFYTRLLIYRDADLKNFFSIKKMGGKYGL